MNIIKGVDVPGKVFYYRDYHFLWALNFPDHEKVKLIGTDWKDSYQVWHTSAPLDPETVKGLDLQPGLK